MDLAGHQSTPTTADNFDVIILGAGISGLVAASILTRQNNRVLVLEDYDRVGGNHIDWTSDEGYTFDVGSLIFQDDSPLLEHFPELLPHYLTIQPSWGRLNPQGKITLYPVSIRDDIVGAGILGLAQILGSVAYARLFQRQLRSARDYARYWIGARLLRRSGLEAYMKRFYGLPAEEIDLDLARKRMLWISEYASATAFFKRLLPLTRSHHSTNRQLARPREGFDKLYRVAVDRLEREGAAFILAAKTEKIARRESGFDVIVSSGRVSAPRIVSTIPIARAERLCGLATLRTLKTITLITLYFSFAGQRGFHQSIVYNFSHGGAWKRLTVYSDFYGRVAGREYFAVEVIGGMVDTIDAAEADFRQHCRGNGMFLGDLALEGGQILEHAYPIYTKGAAADAADAIERLKIFGIESMGRHGAFNYQPTARVSTIDVEAELSRSEKAES